MTAPERRRPLPALAFIAALCVITALVWFRVLHRNDAAAPATAACSRAVASSGTSSSSSAPASSTPAPAAANPAVLPAPQTVSVVVLNSTQRNGLAAATKAALVKRGFRVTQAADDSAAFGGHGLIAGIGEIRYGPRAAAAAKLLQYYVPGAALKPNRGTSSVVTVSVGQTFKALAVATTVSAALAKAHLTVSAAPLPPTPSPTKTC